MKLTPAQKVRLSAFLLLGAGLLVAALLWVGGTIVLQKRSHYVVRFEDDVSGLENSAQVKYRGFRVGRVEQIRLAPDDPRVIEVTLSLDPEVPLYEGVKAQLAMSGLTGMRTVNLVGGDPRGTPLPEGSQIPPDLSFIGQIVDQATMVAARVNEIADHVRNWTSDENRKRFESILVSLDNVLRAADKTLQHNDAPLTKTIASVGKASEAITALSIESTQTLQAIRGDLVGTLHAVRAPLEKIDPNALNTTIIAARGAMVSLERRLSADETGVAIKNFGVAMTNVASILQEADVAVRASRENFTATMASFREAAEDLREFSRIIAQDPSVLIRGRELRE